MGERFQWVVRGVDRDLAGRLVDLAARQRKTAGELLNEVLTGYLESVTATGPEAPAVPDLAVIDAAGIRLDVDDLKARVAQLETALTLVQRDLVTEKAPTAPEGADGLQQRLDRMESGLTVHDERLAALKAQIDAAESAKAVVVVSEPAQGAASTGLPMDGPAVAVAQEPPPGEFTNGKTGRAFRLKPAGEVEIVRLHDLGRSEDEVPAAIGCTVETVRRCLRDAGRLPAKASGTAVLPLDPVPAPVPALDSTDTAITASPDAGGPADASQNA